MFKYDSYQHQTIYYYITRTFHTLTSKFKCIDKRIPDIDEHIKIVILTSKLKYINEQIPYIDEQIQIIDKQTPYYEQIQIYWWYNYTCLWEEFHIFTSKIKYVQEQTFYMWRSNSHIPKPNRSRANVRICSSNLHNLLHGMVSLPGWS